MKKTYKNSNLNELKILCPKHPNFLITHGCMDLECSEEMLFCSSCLLENLHHITEHKKFITTLPDFIHEYFMNFSNIKENLRPLEEMNFFKNNNNYSNFQNNFNNFNSSYNVKNLNNAQTWQKMLKDQKQMLQTELNQLKSQFNNMIEQLKENVYEQINKMFKDVEITYQTVQKVLDHDNLLDLNYRNQEDLIDKLKDLNSHEINNFFVDMRKSFRFLKTPINSNIIQNYINYSKKLDDFLRNPKENDNNLHLIESFQNQMDQLIYNISEKIKQNLFNDQQLNHLNVQHYNEPCSSYKILEKPKQNYLNIQPNEPNIIQDEPIFTCNNSQMPDNTRTPIKMLKTNSDISHTISPIINNNSYNSYFPKKAIDSETKGNPLMNNSYFPKKAVDSEMKENPLMNSFRNINKMNKFDIFENPSQKNFLIKNDLFFSKENLFKLEVKLETSFEDENNNSSLCLINLNETILVSAGKDSNIRIFEFNRFSNNKSNLKLIKILQNAQDDSPIWSLAKLSTINYQKNDFGIFYFASGSENGNVCIWKLDYKKSNLENSNKPLIQLLGNFTIEIITSILDLNDGNHLICGDSKGSLMVWDFLYGKMIQNFEVHKDQINNIIAFNNYANLAIGSYDGNVTLWEISNKNSDKFEIFCFKMIKNNFYVYGLTTLYSRNYNIIVVDSQKKLKILDSKTFLYIKESESLTKSETLMDVLCIESIGNLNSIPLIFCFTKTQLIILNGDNMEIIKCFDNTELKNNNIGATMNSNYKVVFLKKSCSETLEKDNIVFFGIIDQSAKSKKILSIFKISF